MQNKLPTSSEEIVQAAIKGSVSAIPVVGGLVSELGACLVSPLEKRKRAWAEEVEAALLELAAKHQRLPTSLAEDPAFLTALLQATTAALATHQQRKIAALRTFLVAVGARTIADEELQQALVRLLSELSVGHMEVLCFLESEARAIAEKDTLEGVFGRYHYECGGRLDRMSFRWMLADLASQMVVHLGDIEDMNEFASRRQTRVTSDSSIRPLQITKLGYQLLTLLRDEQGPQQAAVPTA